MVGACAAGAAGGVYKANVVWVVGRVEAAAVDGDRRCWAEVSVLGGPDVAPDVNGACMSVVSHVYAKLTGKSRTHGPVLTSLCDGWSNRVKSVRDRSCMLCPTLSVTICDNASATVRNSLPSLVEVVSSVCGTCESSVCPVDGCS